MPAEQMVPIVRGDPVEERKFCTIKLGTGSKKGSLAPRVCSPPTEMLLIRSS